MIKKQRRKFSSEFKSTVVIEVLAHPEKQKELAFKYDLNSKQIAGWTKEFLDKAHLVFELKAEPAVTKSWKGEIERKLEMNR